MFSFKNALIAFGWLLLISITPLKGISQDTLINIDDVEFSSGQEETGSTDTLISDLEGVEFSSGEDTAATDSTATVAPAVDSTDNQEANTSLWGIFIEGLLGGFLAFLMPCIFPMVPLTVSFFTKKSASKLQAVSQALTYGLFIIVIYVALGMLITIAFGPEAMNALSTNGVFNFFFFLMLVFFAASFFGAFEITLPSKFVNKIDEKSDKGGLIGYFFMAASLAVVSFSCTGPIIGTVLVNAAVKGDRLGPAIAMFGFSFALAIPFVLFAMFPALLKSMPKIWRMVE
jgi:thiol:disulfide interchange protein